MAKWTPGAGTAMRTAMLAYKPNTDPGKVCFHAVDTLMIQWSESGTKASASAESVLRGWQVKVVQRQLVIVQPVAAQPVVIWSALHTKAPAFMVVRG